MITSLQNKHVRDVVKLHKRKYRDQQRKLIVEGYRAILCAVENEYPLGELYFCPAFFLGNNERSLIRRVERAGVQVFEVAEGPFYKMACGGRTEGLLAVAHQICRSLHGLPAVAGGIYVIAESIERPGNLGSIVRSADGAGATAIVMCDRRTDVFDPKAVRASMGTLFSTPILESSTQQALVWCRENGVCTLAATPSADIVYTDVNMRKAVAIAVGAEYGGLSKVWMEQADVQVRLPMLGQVDSLDVAAAATLLLYEAVRQRRLDGRGQAGEPKKNDPSGYWTATVRPVIMTT